MAKQTKATQALDRLGKPYELLEYDYDSGAESIGLAAAAAMGLPPSSVFKTLMVTLGAEVVVAVIPSDHELSMKALAHLAGAKSAAMVKPAEAERISGYHVGGISPLGQKKRLRCFLDDSALSLDFVVVNGGRRGLQIKIAPAELVLALEARTAALIQTG